jgi:hypothetical protein
MNLIHLPKDEKPSAMEALTDMLTVADDYDDAIVILFNAKSDDGPRVRYTVTMSETVAMLFAVMCGLTMQE